MRLTLLLSLLMAAGLVHARPVIDFTSDLSKDLHDGNGATATLVPEEGLLRIQYEPVGPWPGASIRGPKEGWDLAEFDAIEVAVHNSGDTTCEFSVRVDSPKPPDDKTKPYRLSVGGRVTLGPGQEKVVRVPLRRHREGLPLLVGMDRFPQGMVGDDDRVNPHQVNNVVFYLFRPTEPATVEISRVEAVGTYEPQPWEKMDADAFFPFVDKFGQFKHQEWPGKISSDADLIASWEREQEALAAMPRPKNWNQYGGYEAGPQLEATGRFRTEKRDGTWWLVDPAGRLFFSQGISGISDAGGSATGIDDRRHYFEWLPEQEGQWADCYHTQNRVSRGFYQGKQPLCFSFRTANMIRKYGEDWEETKLDLVHRRFHSWGLNTLGCWTRPEVWERRETPYCTWVFYRPKPIWGKMRGWKRFPDVFDPTFAERFRAGAERFLPVSKGDTWCIGVFSDNELPWWDSVTMAQCVLTAPPGQVAKQVFIEDLKTTYTTIEALNDAWRTDLESWEAMLQNRDHIRLTFAEEDAAAFYEKLARTYFETARDAIKAIDPDFLYLGVRFNGDFQEAARIAAEYVDVISYNFYRQSVGDFAPPPGVDKPCVIGEFHFGALDRGLFGPGLVPVANQEARRQAYHDYVMSGVRNPYIVGTHWFTYGDQAISGRALDAENHQIGFVDVTDTPYDNLVGAAREIAGKLYTTRLKVAAHE